MKHIPAILCLIGSLALFTDAHAVLQSSGSSRILTLAVIAQLPDGRGSVGLVDSRGVMTILNQDEHTRPCRVLEVRSGEADLDCGLGLQTFGIGDVVKVEAGSQGTCG